MARVGTPAPDREHARAPGRPDAPAGLRAGGVYALGLVAQVGSSVVALPVLARLLGPAELGVSATALVVLNGLAIVAAGGVPVLVQRAVAMGEIPEGRRLIGLAVGHALVVGSLGSAALAMTGTGTVLHLAVLAGSVTAVRRAYEEWYRGGHQPARVLTVCLAGTVGGQALGVVFAAAGRGTASEYLLGLALGSLVAVGVGLVDVRPARPELSAVRTGVLLAAPVLGHQLASLALHAGDRFLVGWAEGSAGVGHYQVAYVVGMVGLPVLTALMWGWLPRMHALATADQAAELRGLAGLLATPARLAAAGLAVGGPAALAVVVPGFDIDRIAPVVALLALGIPVLVVRSLAIGAVLASGRTRLLTLPTACGAVVALGSAAVLIPVAGLPGAAVATVAGYAVQAWLLARDAGVDGLAAGMAFSPGVVVAAVAGTALPFSAPWIALRLAVGALLAVRLAVHVRRSRPA